MELTRLETLTVRMIFERHKAAMTDHQERVQIFKDGVAERTGIPAGMLHINADTGTITDLRVATPPGLKVVASSEPESEETPGAQEADDAPSGP